MTKLKKYLTVFAATVLLVSAFAPGLILSAEIVGSDDVSVLYYTSEGGYKQTATATAWSDDEQCWASATIWYNGSICDSDYDQATPPAGGYCTALAFAYGDLCGTVDEADDYLGSASYGGF